MWELFATAQMIYVVNGRKINEWQPTAENKENILAKAIGRSGNLRAPTIKVGDNYIVGFNEALYAQLLIPSITSSDGNSQIDCSADFTN